MPLMPKKTAMAPRPTKRPKDEKPPVKTLTVKRTQPKLKVKV